jgi:hypothetical protein
MEASMKPAALRAIADMADALARLCRAAADEAELGPDPNAQLPEREAARIAGVSLRTLRDARRDGDLIVYGKQRSRTVRRADLDAWIASRRQRPVMGPDDEDIERRMAKIEAARNAKARKAKR